MRSTRRVSVLVASIAMVLGGAGAAEAVKASATDADKHAGNVLVQRLWYKVDPGRCIHGQDGYRMLRTTFRFKPADSQFRAGFHDGRMNSASLRCHEGQGSYNKSRQFAGPRFLEPGKTYSRDFGKTKWVILPHPESYLFNGYVALDVYRGDRKVGDVCTEPFVANQGGSPCRAMGYAD